MKTIIRKFTLRNFTVIVEAMPEHEVSMYFDDTGEIERQIESGELEAFSVKVSVLMNGAEIATDYLGGCIYRSPAEFMDHKGLASHNRKTGHNCGSYFSDMVRTVCSEARDAVRKLQDIHVRA